MWITPLLKRRQRSAGNDPARTARSLKSPYPHFLSFEGHRLNGRAPFGPLGYFLVLMNLIMIGGVSATLKIGAAVTLVALGWAELLRRDTLASRRTRGTTLLDVAHLVLTLASAIAYTLKTSVYCDEEHYVCIDAIIDLVMCITLILLFSLSLYRFLCAQYTSGFVFIILVVICLTTATEFLAMELRVFQDLHVAAGFSSIATTLHITAVLLCASTGNMVIYALRDTVVICPSSSKYVVPEEEEAKSLVGVLFVVSMYRSLRTLIISKTVDLSEIPKLGKSMICTPAIKEAYRWSVKGGRTKKESSSIHSVFWAVWLDAFWVLMTHLGYYACLTARSIVLESLIAGTGSLSSMALLFVATCVGEASLTCCMNHLCSAFSERFQVLMQGAVFARMLRHSATARRFNPPGYIMSVFSVDCTTLSFGVTLIPMPAAGLLVMPLIFYMLVRRVGIEAAMACAVWLLLTTAALGFLLAKLRAVERVSLQKRDERLKHVLELLNSIRTVKMYAWERNHAKVLQALRSEELRCVLKVDIISGVLEAFTGAAGSLLTIIMYGTLWLLQPTRMLSASASFSSVYLLSLVEAFLNSLPLLMIMTNRMSFAMSRVVKLCCAEESGCEEEAMPTEKYPEAGEVILEKCSFARTKKRCGSLCLRDISLRVAPGSLVGIAGPVGSGKSTLLKAILGELHAVHGTVTVKGRVAYVPQVACVFNMTLRDNVLFGEAYEPDRYREVLEACALTRDISSLPAGDLTELGEKGYNLSGGQKQRICLARAAYHDSNVYILDDPLSALDANVSTAVFNRLLGRKGLLSNKTRLIVTSQTRLLEHMDYVFFMCGKTGAMVTKPAGLYNNGGTCNMHDVKVPGMNGFHRREQVSGEEALRGKLVQDENSAPTKALCDVMWNSLKSCGFGMVPAILLLAVSSVAASWQLVWIKRWTDSASVKGNPGDPAWIWGLALLSVGTVLSRAAGNVLVALGANRLSRLLHRDMLDRVLRSPVAFFDSTPRGRILNRFAADASTLDTRLASYSRQTVQNVLLAVARVAAIGTERLAVLGIGAAVAAIFAFGMRYLPRAVNSARFAKNAHLSRLLQHVNETAESMSVVRAHGATRRFLARFCRLADANLRLCLASVGCVRLTRVFSSASGLAVVLATLAFAIGEDPSTAGLVLNSSLAIPIIMVSLCTALLGITQIVVALERQLEYAELPDEEYPDVTDHGKLVRREASAESKTVMHPEWPTEGRIEFQDYCASYQPSKLDDCLSNITFTILPRQKVGIVGRTGAGKSSLVLALLRIIRATRGRILVDGVDIALLPLRRLRTAITVIPQDPCLVDGTLRANLDPRECHSDEELHRVLRQAHLASYVKRQPDGLRLRTGTGGERLSVGQRQLVCLARALLRRPKILVLDEATSQMDSDTDSLIQATLRDSFAASTVLTVAHRIHTVLDYDKILVMSDGKVLEFASVQDLLEDHSSTFFNMAKSAAISQGDKNQGAEEECAPREYTKL
ncbi:multidrug resistance-associated protein 1-like isoform X3 [Dermacentor albipictus]|uniref:multidrug resistance-associated protein 1-like isoform X3 n=1 Tax=Dermacentor albipictus TaxID=60249 RepID=UPI0038FC25AA